MNRKKINRDVSSVGKSVNGDVNDAKSILSSVSLEKSFWVNNGVVVSSIKELPKVLESMSDDAFKHHVNEEKNDFVNWIDEVVRDKKLARSLRKEDERESLAGVIRWRVSHLKSINKNKSRKRKTR